jgi:hypothetical protein
LAGRAQAHVFRAELSRHWVEKKPDVLGFLYVDGHVRPYNGKKHTLPKAFVPRRRLSMPATTDFWVNDEDANPVFFITAPANDGLVSMIDREVLPEIRRLVGEVREVTVIFDREGWSPKRFEQWKEKDFDVITYRKSPYDDWPEEDFTEQELRVGGKSVVYRLAERSVKVGRGFSMREVRKLCDDGHQLSIMTTREDISAPQIAERMFSRWRQENFFRYMRHEYALDHLCTNAVESADGDRLVPNPQRREKRKQLKELRAQLSKLERDYGEHALANPESQRPSMRGFKIAHADLSKRIRQLQEQCEATNSAINALPERVPIRELLDEKQIVQLEQERKVLTDTIKMVAYRTETSLTELLRPFFPRHEEEARNFMKAVFRLPANLVPMHTEQRMIVRLHSMSNPRSNRALAALCDVVNQSQTRYPDTDLRLVFETV